MTAFEELTKVSQELTRPSKEITKASEKLTSASVDVDVDMDDPAQEIIPGAQEGFRGCGDPRSPAQTSEDHRNCSRCSL